MSMALVGKEHSGMSGRGLLTYLIRHNSAVIFAILFIASSFMSDAFLTEGNLFNLLRQLTPLMLASLGMLLVINTAGIDLSVGSIAGAGGLLLPVLVPYLPFDGAWALLIGVILCVGFGALFGVVNGVLVAYTDLAPFIVTLAMLTITRGITFVMTNGQPVQIHYSSSINGIVESFGSDGLPYIGLPWPVVLAILAVGFFYFVMNHTTFGRMVVATGSNETAVHLAGMPARRYKMMVYVISGAMAGLAGLVITSRTSVGTPSAGTGLELDAIAACVIGGALLSGGKGTVLNTVIGVLVLGLIGNVMNLLSVPAYPQQIIKGLIILAAVLMQRVSNRRAG